MSLIYKNESYEIIGACIELHRELGTGFLESVYQEALSHELSLHCIPFEQEVELNIVFKGYKLDKQFYVDFICYDKIILELKAVDNLSGIHEAQVVNYLKASGLKLGLLVNFGTEKLEYKRLVKNISK